MNTINSPDDEHGVAYHVENCNKHIRKKNCASSWLFTRIFCTEFGLFEYYIQCCLNFMS
jgi:hypothetical protein